MKNAPPESLDRYARTLLRSRPFGLEEELVLVRRAQAGDPSARSALVEHNLAFVVMLARRQRLGTLSIHDIVQEGCLGLLRAVETFDPESGNRFCTYGSWWVRAYIGKFLKEARSSVRRSGGTAQADFSLDTPPAEGGELTHLDVLEDERVDVERDALRIDVRRRVGRSLAGLRGRFGRLGADVLYNRLAKDPPDTLAEIGFRHGLSRERVRQVETDLKRILERRLAEEVEAA